MAITDAERREVARWAAGSAERVLPLFEALAPTDARPREAIGIARAFADGEGRSRRLFRIALAAHRAGAEVNDPVGLAVARAASLAAATANIHGENTIGTLGHILGSATYAAVARELTARGGAAGAGAAGGDADGGGAAGGDADGGDAVTDAADTPTADDEVRWAIEHASPAIRDLVRRVPAAVPGRRRLDQIQRQLDTALRGQPLPKAAG